MYDALLNFHYVMSLRSQESRFSVVDVRRHLGLILETKALNVNAYVVVTWN
jgi:hypothetical protein